jgi:hypothetical protein
MGLPDRVEPGVFGFTYMADPWQSGELVAQEIQFDWRGESWATWTQDISGDEAISPGSSAPVVGWASWRNGSDLLVAFSSEDLETDGWARLPGAAPTSGADGDDHDEDDVLGEPARWLSLARVITAIVYEQDLPGATGERFSS